MRQQLRGTHTRRVHEWTPAVDPDSGSGVNACNSRDRRSILAPGEGDRIHSPRRLTATWFRSSTDGHADRKERHEAMPDALLIQA